MFYATNQLIKGLSGYILIISRYLDRKIKY